MADATARSGPDRARSLQLQGQLLVLRDVHAGLVSTRAELTQRHGMSRGSVSEIAGRLREAHLLDERPTEPAGRRGRPTAQLRPHPDGPLVCAVDIGHERWDIGLAALGGAFLTRHGRRHGPDPRDRGPAAVLGAVAAAVADVLSGYERRVVAISFSVAAAVQGTRLVQFSTLGWRDVELTDYVAADYRPVLLGNEATLAGLAEARRGAATGARVSLHLGVGVGVGGVLVVDGRPQVGATGAGGEFGHLPFGDPARRCPCGATGCWDVEVDGRAMARLLNLAEPADPRTLAERVLADAVAGDRAAVRVTDAVAAALGRGVGGLTNALDPDLVTLSGLGADLLAVAGPALRAAYRDALMAFRREAAPPVTASTVPEPVTLTGAAEAGFDAFLTEAGLYAWEPRGTW
jgi:predicted NBD/HSP70 family sugar kinase